MREAFHGWHRKCWLTALLFALLVMGAWGRSQISRDRLSLPVAPKTSYGIALGPKGFELYCMHDIVADAIQMTTDTIGSAKDSEGSLPTMTLKTDEEVSLMEASKSGLPSTNETGAKVLAESGADDGAGESRQAIRRPVRVAYATESTVAEIPYWPLIALLTILSALLLLSQPRRMRVETKERD